MPRQLWNYPARMRAEAKCHTTFVRIPWSMRMDGAQQPVCFDEAGLAFLYQDKMAGGKQSNFDKLIRHEHAQ
ncbi:MAG TPA: hypothetical protein VIM48_05165 [Chthoniobacterales bacterium]